MKKLFIALLALTALLAINAQAQQRTAEEYIKLLEGERRVENLQVPKVIETLKIKSNHKIADIGSGSGLFSRPLAKHVNKGQVYAVDIDQKLLDHVAKTSADEKLTNVKTIFATEDDPKLPEPVDLIVIIDTMHHIANQPTYVKTLKKYLRKNGRIVIIDFNKTWPAGHEKMVYKLEDLDGWMKAAGYKKVESYDFLDNNFFVVYQ